MTLVGPGYLVYVASSEFRELARQFVDPDDYGAIYQVTQTTHPRSIEPSRSELDAAHWTMFLALLEDDYPELRGLSEKRGFAGCWEVHELDIELAQDAISDAEHLRTRER